MAKPRTIYSCQNCGAQSPRWIGRCPECSQWNTYVEETLEQESRIPPPSRGSSSAPTLLGEIAGDDGKHVAIGIAELDRVLGSGYVPGGVALFGGDPGIGKSTIIMQALAKLSSQKRPVVYVSGEESPSQIRLRAERMGLGDSKIIVLAENCVERALAEIKKIAPSVVAIDSIQTMFTEEMPSSPGTVGQVRESAARILNFAKSTQTAAFLVGHVTKDGSIAGPKVLEHMVDTVLYFEGERGHSFRILRAIKNRFGSTNEIGVFEMTGKGLIEVPDPSGIFLAERPMDASGSAVTASLEGSRPVLLEVQALVSSSGFGTPRRTSLGIDNNRIALLVAVLEKVEGLELKTSDIFVNVAGGMRIAEPAADLGVIASLNSSFRNKPIDPHCVVIGEVGLTGEVRAVNGIELRLKEAKKMGFRRAIVPRSNLKAKMSFGMEVFGTSNVAECLKML